MSPPRRPTDLAARGGRSYLTPAEVEKVAAAANRTGRHGPRDALMIRVCHRHGLRVTELVELRRDQVDLAGGVLHVRRLKRGTPATHPLSAWETRALRQTLRESDGGVYLFVSERGGPLTRWAFAKMLARAGDLAGLDFPVHPHMLRHGAGYKLANDGVDTRSIQVFLGHRSIQCTTRYTEISPKRLEGLWKD